MICPLGRLKNKLIKHNVIELVLMPLNELNGYAELILVRRHVASLDNASNPLILGCSVISDIILIENTPAKPLDKSIGSLMSYAR